MAKQKMTRLNKSNREWLEREAMNTIKDKPDEHKAFIQSIKLADKELRRCLKKTVPLADMKTLAKYGYGFEVQNEVYVTLAPIAGKFAYPRQSTFYIGGHRDAWSYNKGEWSFFKPESLLLPKRDYRVTLDEQATIAHDDWAARVAARDKRLAELRQAMKDLIWNAPNLEMIEEVWPGATQLRATLPPPATLPTVIAENAMDKVREALLARQL